LPLDTLDPYPGELRLEQVHDDTLAPFKKVRLAAGIRAGTINRDIAAARRVLNLAARKWRQQNGRAYLASAPLLDLVKGERRELYPLGRDEQKRVLQELLPHLEQMALFDPTAGLRDQELVTLRWHWEVQVRELECLVFILPEEITKNGEERVLVLNRVARNVLDAQRGRHPEFVFTFGGRPITGMDNTSWGKARRQAGLPNLRVHDMRHTFWSSFARCRRVDRRPEDVAGS
jgi:integrase